MKLLRCAFGILFVAVLFAALAVAPAYGAGLVPVQLSASLTATDLAQQLVGPGVSVSNVTFKGVNGSAGTFTGGTGIVGFEQGVILSSGSIANVVGPNTVPNASADLGLPGDADLTLLSGNTTYDATVLEFDFVPTEDTIYGQYVFASEEYNEYVGSFNDVFAFLLDGQNAALVNGQPVSVNTVNMSSNSAFFINNTDGHLNTQMDGLTTVLTFSAPTNPGVVNHVKFAIADTLDHVYDADVFLRTGSFSTDAPEKVVIGAGYGDQVSDTYLYEAQPTGFFGNSTANFVGKTGMGEERTVLSFPLAKLSGTTVTSATVSLTKSTGSFIPLRAYRLRPHFGKASWNASDTGTAWGAAGAKDPATDYYANLYATSANGNFQVGQLLNAAIAAGATSLDIIVVDPAPVLRRYTGFYSADCVYAPYRPALIVEGYN